MNRFDIWMYADFIYVERFQWYCQISRIFQMAFLTFRFPLYEAFDFRLYETSKKVIHGDFNRPPSLIRIKMKKKVNKSTRGSFR